MDSKSPQTHQVRLLDSGPKELLVKAEYDPQNPRSIIPRRYVEALGASAKIELFPQLATETFQDRHQTFYVAIGTVKLQWFKRATPVATKFYVVNGLGSKYADSKVEMVVGGAEDVNGVIANFLDDAVPFLPVFIAKMTKEQRNKQEEKKRQKEQERAQNVKDEEAAEKQQNDIERQKRQQQQRPP